MADPQSHRDEPIDGARTADAPAADGSTEGSARIPRSSPSIVAAAVCSVLLAGGVAATVAQSLMGHGRDRATPATVTLSRHIDINAAPASELCLLPGIGPKLAERIVAERDTGGPFADLVDLQRVKGVAEGIAGQIEPFVVFGATLEVGPEARTQTRPTVR